MLIMTKIRWKNFLSTGNSFTELTLDDTPNALIIGENGSGKSTMLDAICFALFGKSFRNINKPKLVNSINSKNCAVEIEFKTNGKEYKVIRGIKPNVFEIHCDGLCINQDSKSKDYQEHLEKFILKMNFKSFTQIVILGSASFTPFMQLTPADRRLVIEDLLDIQIFSTMNQIAKQKHAENRESLERNRIESIGRNDKIAYIKNTLKSLRETNESALQSQRERFKKYQDEVDLLKKDILDNTEEIQSREKQITGLSSMVKKIKDANVILTKLELNLYKASTEHSFYHDNDTCPTCQQNIDEALKKSKIDELSSKTVEGSKAIELLKKKIATFEDELARMQEIQKEVIRFTNKNVENKARIDSLLSHMGEMISEVDVSIIQKSEKELTDALLKSEQSDNERKVLLEEKSYIETAINLLKDGGIKTKIIKQYLPIINSLINKYLTQMGFCVQFELNENFEETIKSRFISEFSYQNFSEGEKMRINLAILFAWRAIARKRNSVHTNLLIFDEIFDGSLDTNGTDEFLKIMWSLTEGTNTFVISHKTQMIDKFDKCYKFQKVKNYSIMVESDV
jgi:DNA repair exonuclease SbcCD ATPase subunit